ncbi:MAG: ribbon-helix-helix domain-containing protein [Desulfurivibrionaceae bacterium]|jgi:metal-responsive CopG/Arc/MetJ family transcriptional regulator
MLAEKVSISLPPSLLDFVERYKENHALKSRSKVIEMALEHLRQESLEAAYREAATEVDPAFDAATADGLADETW